MKSCLNCKHLAQNYSKLSEYHQSIANPEEDYTCESGKGFSPTWLFGNPKAGMNCGGNYYQTNLIKMNKPVILKEIMNVVKAHNFSFQEDFDYEDEVEANDFSDISFSTREKGRNNYENAKIIKEEIEADFPDVKCEIEPVDEWTMLYIKFKRNA